MSNAAWPCPTDLADGEILEIEDPYGGGSIDAEVVDTINGVTSVAIASLMDTVCSIDPRYTKWRRKAPKVVYGVRCTDRFCNEWFPHAEAVPNFKCWQCKKR